MRIVNKGKYLCSIKGYYCKVNTNNKWSIFYLMTIINNEKQCLTKSITKKAEDGAFSDTEY